MSNPSSWKDSDISRPEWRVEQVYFDRVRIAVSSEDLQRRGKDRFVIAVIVQQTSVLCCIIFDFPERYVSIFYNGTIDSPPTEAWARMV